MKELKGAEIFHAGEWPGAGAKGVTFTEADLDSLVSSFDALQLKGRVPLKLGHDGKDARHDGSPALGWVSRVWRDGQKLLADFSDVHDTVYEAVKQGLYKNVSVEMLRNVTAGTRAIPWVLDAVALLGATQPAVGILKDLQQLTMARGTGLQCEGHAAFTRDLSITGGKAKMTEEEIAELKAKAARADAAEAQTKVLQGEKVTMHREKITDALEAAVKAQRILPAARERFVKFAGVNDDARVLEVSMTDVTAYIDENATGKKADASGTPTSRVEGEKVTFTAKTNDTAWQEACEKEAVAQGEKVAALYADHALYERVTMAVARKYPKLAQAYWEAPSGEFKMEAA